MKEIKFRLSRFLQLSALTGSAGAVLLLGACEGRQAKLGEDVDDAMENIQEAQEQIADGKKELVEAKQELVEAKQEAAAGLDAPAPTPEPIEKMDDSTPEPIATPFAEPTATPDAEPVMTPTADATPELTVMPTATPVQTGDFPPTPEPSL